MRLRHASPRRTRSRTGAAIAVCLGALCGPVPARAGGSAENAVLIVDPSRPDALTVANAYRRARGIPDANVVYMRPADGTGFVAQRATRLAALQSELTSRGIDAHVDFVILAPTERYRVSAGGLLTDDCFPAGDIGVSTAYGLARIADEIAAGGLDVTEPNRYFQVDGPLRGFSSDVAWLDGVPSAAAGARRYRIGALLGWTGARGNSVAEILAMIDRSAAVDGTFPIGTFSFHHTGDAARSAPRHDVFPSVRAAIEALGGATVEDVEAVPKGRYDCLGIMTGASDPKIAEGDFAILPGAFCDHLTSWAADFDQSSQTKISAWIAKGASASVGAVAEPCNYPGKFPRAELHLFSFEGATLGEAWFRSTQYVPFQMLFCGDPLTRPFAHVPHVSVTGLGSGPVSGTVALTPTATTTHPAAAIASFDLLVDGVLVDSTVPGGTLSLATCAIDDGRHELRVLAHDDSLLATTGSLVTGVVVDNLGLSASLTTLGASGSLTTAFAFDLAASGGDVEEIVLMQASRVVASARPGPGETARVVVHGRVLGAGDVELRAVARFADGRRARSAPLTVAVADSEGASPAAPPVAYGYRRALSGPGPHVVELPATFADGLDTATFEVVDAPLEADVSMGETGPVRLVVPHEDATGTDTLTFRVTTPSGQSNTATIALDYGAVAPIASVSVASGKLVDRTKARRDSFRATGVAPPPAGFDADAFEPSEHALVLELGDACRPVRVRLGPEDGTWKRKRGRFKFRGRRGTSPRVAFRIDPRTGAFRVAFGRGDFPALPENPIRISIELGDLRASSDVYWLESGRRPGRFRYVP